MTGTQIPEAWKMRRLKYVASLIAGQSADGAAVNDSGEGLPFLQGCAEFGNKSPCADRYCSEPPKIAPAGSWLISVRAPVGRINYADRAYGIGRGLAAVSADEVDTSFLGYVLEDSASALNSLATGSTFSAVSTPQLGSIQVLVPPLIIQRRITIFLNEKTAQIDALIAKKQSLLNRLAEKRQAIITQAVTKGLNPSARLKESGVEYLGQIPEHWDVKRLRYLLDGDTRSGLYKPKDQFDKGGVPFVQMGEAFRDLHFSGGTKDRVSSSQSEISGWGLRFGDFLIARRSIVFEGSGKSVLIGELKEPHLFESSMIRLRLCNPQFSKFLYYYFQSLPCRASLLSVTKQVTISGIDSQQLKDIAVPIPRKDEDKEIARFVEDRERRIDTLIDLTTAAIAKLISYRTSLVTAAVTGQISELQ